MSGNQQVVAGQGLSWGPPPPPPVQTARVTATLSEPKTTPTKPQPASPPPPPPTPETESLSYYPSMNVNFDVTKTSPEGQPLEWTLHFKNVFQVTRGQHNPNNKHWIEQLRTPYNVGLDCTRTKNVRLASAKDITINKTWKVDEYEPLKFSFDIDVDHQVDLVFVKKDKSEPGEMRHLYSYNAIRHYDLEYKYEDRNTVTVFRGIVLTVTPELFAGVCDRQRFTLTSSRPNNTNPGDYNENGGTMLGRFCSTTRCFVDKPQDALPQYRIVRVPPGAKVVLGDLFNEGRKLPGSTVNTEWKRAHDDIGDAQVMDIGNGMKILSVSRYGANGWDIQGKTFYAIGKPTKTFQDSKWTIDLYFHSSSKGKLVSLTQQDLIRRVTLNVNDVVTPRELDRIDGPDITLIAISYYSVEQIIACEGTSDFEMVIRPINKYAEFKLFVRRVGNNNRMTAGSYPGAELSFKLDAGLTNLKFSPPNNNKTVTITFTSDDVVEKEVAQIELAHSRRSDYKLVVSHTVKTLLNVAETVRMNKEKAARRQQQQLV